MIKHIVMFKLKDQANVAKACEVLLSMKDKVPQVRSIEVGCDCVRSHRSCDVALTVMLDDMKALEDYQNDPYHVDVVKKFMHQVVESSVAADYNV